MRGNLDDPATEEGRQDDPVPERPGPLSPIVILVPTGMPAWQAEEILEMENQLRFAVLAGLKVDLHVETEGRWTGSVHWPDFVLPRAGLGPFPLRGRSSAVGLQLRQARCVLVAMTRWRQSIDART